MRAYLVRMIKGHDLIGIFVAASRIQLQMIVDECADIDQCEYAPMPAGGIYWEEPAITIPVPENESDDPNAGPFVPWGKATASDAWSMALYEPIPRWRALFQEGDVFPALEMDRADEAAAEAVMAAVAVKSKRRHLRVVK